MQPYHGAPARGESVPLGTVFQPGRFGRMFPYLRPLNPAASSLEKLADAMKDTQPDSESGDNRNIAAGFTYLGQFVDHDITLDTTALSEEPIDPQAVHNFRTPKLELDSIYGFGPGGQPYLYEREQPAKFSLGSTIVGRGDPNIPAGFPNDLPRSGQGFALIGDPRNDENLLVAQLHLAFLKFHNKVVDKLVSEGHSEATLFESARETVRWHYQYIVLFDMIAKMIDFNVLHSVLKNGRKFYNFTNEPFIPIEFSVAAYRLGHSMVRQVYNHNRVFRPGNEPIPPGTLELLFTFSGRSGIIRGPGENSLTALPSDWIIDWRRFFDFQTTGTRPDEGFALNFSRKIDPMIAEELHELPNNGGSLPRLNLLRGLRMSLPSGQDVARAMTLKPLSPAEIATGPDGKVAKEQGFDQATPLWYYILKEAEVEGRGERLGQVGSRILAEVFVGLLEGDPESFLAQDRSWTPTLPSEFPGQFRMTDLLRFVDDLNPIG